MTEPWIECVPNFSEGRRTEVIERLQDAIRSVPGTLVLDVESDADHNRSVITFAGAPAAVVEAAFTAIAQAAKDIDLEKHRGEHPRIGATDVVPLVPIGGVTLEECVALARQLGARVGEELGIPVFLYEAAATRPDRTHLEEIRRGEYEALKESIQTDPDRTPDFGPNRLGPAGATVIGARPPLIAYNIYLTTSDVAVARRIAAAIRHSSGGLRYVKALGLEVNGRAQVSMNLTDFTRTPLARVVEMVRREARRYGADVLRSELVGLIPQQAVLDAASWYLQLEGFSERQVLEMRLNRMREAPAPAGPGFLDELAAATPTPGGGSAAASAAAMAAALVGMVARLTIGKKKYETVRSRMETVARSADDLRERLTRAVTDDAAAFEGVLQAMRLPAGNEQEANVRSEALENATRLAARIPMTVALAAAEVAELGAEASEIGNRNAISDAGSAVYLAAAAIRSATLNVRANAAALQDQSVVPDWERAVATAAERAAAAQARVEAAIESRSG
jgi:glutamate formiminotransferase/formiminotetrahydrofolate cyclodeaminase